MFGNKLGNDILPCIRYDKKDKPSLFFESTLHRAGLFTNPIGDGLCHPICDCGPGTIYVPVPDFKVGSIR